MAKVHTLVMHVFPDIETLFMSYLLTSVSEARIPAGVEDGVSFKFIPSGDLRPEDWPGETDLTACALEEKGYLFLDCGGGRFDQHGKPVNALQNTLSSLDLLVHATELDRSAPHLMPIVEIISKNDLTGRDVARDTGMRKSRTPHTPRHLRNIVQGWNMLAADRPSEVLREAHEAFAGMAAAISAGVEDPSTLFLIDQLVKGVELSCAGSGTEEARKRADRFRVSAERALDVLEKDWMRGVNDYWNSTKVTDVTVVTEIKGVTVHRTMTLAVGDSAAHRYGQVTRLGNEGARNRRPHDGRPFRAKADITIQFRGKGKFIISTRGLELDRVARVLREADLRKKGIALTDGDVRGLDQVGRKTFPSSSGEISTLYLAEYRTCFGNTFRSNPYDVDCALSRREVVDLVVKALGDINA